MCVEFYFFRKWVAVWNTSNYLTNQYCPMKEYSGNFLSKTFNIFARHRGNAVDCCFGDNIFSFPSDGENHGEGQIIWPDQVVRRFEDVFQRCKRWEIQCKVLPSYIATSSLHRWPNTSGIDHCIEPNSTRSLGCGITNLVAEIHESLPPTLNNKTVVYFA